MKGEKFMKKAIVSFALVLCFIDEFILPVISKERTEREM